LLLLLLSIIQSWFTFVVSIFNSPFWLILIVSNYTVIRLQTFIRARYAAHLYNSLYQQLPIQQTRPSIKEVTHYNGFECWTTIDYRNRFTCIQQSSYLDKTDNKIMDFKNHTTKHITITVVRNMHMVYLFLTLNLAMVYNYQIQNVKKIDYFILSWIIFGTVIFKIVY
jgi:hypothetical protein